MRRLGMVLAILALSLFTFPALAVNPTSTDEVNSGPPGGGGGSRTNDCPGYIVWDTGMHDNFIPPTGCASAASSQCFVDAENAGGFPADGRRLADDFIADAGRSRTSRSGDASIIRATIITSPIPRPCTASA